MCVFLRFDPIRPNYFVKILIPKKITPATISPVNYINQTLSGSETITSCGDINVQNVTVTNFGNTYPTHTTITSCGNINVQNVAVTNYSNGVKLTLDAADTTTINGPFKVELGSAQSLTHSHQVNQI